MEALGPIYEQYVTFAQGLSDAILNWADPTGVMKNSPTRVSE